MEIHDKFYQKYMERLFDRLKEGMDISNKLNGTKAAFLFLAIRDTDNAPGNIDIIGNVTDESLIHILEVAINTIKTKTQKENVDGEYSAKNNRNKF